MKITIELNTLEPFDLKTYNRIKDSIDGKSEAIINQADAENLSKYYRLVCDCLNGRLSPDIKENLTRKNQDIRYLLIKINRQLS